MSNPLDDPTAAAALNTAEQALVTELEALDDDEFAAWIRTFHPFKPDINGGKVIRYEAARRGKPWLYDEKWRVRPPIE